MWPWYQPDFLLRVEVMKDTEMLQHFGQFVHTWKHKLLVRNMQYWSNYIS